MEQREQGLAVLPRAFYERAPEVVASALLGKVLVSRVDGVVTAGRIVETEAYLGPHRDPVDRAAHSHRGPTPRNRVLFGAAGHAYVYSIYGQYFCMNVSCEPEGRAGCVLLRALEPLEGLDEMARRRGIALDGSGKMLRGLTSGPSRLCMALGIARAAHNGADLTDGGLTEVGLTNAGRALAILDDGCEVRDVRVTARIGIHPENEAVDWPMRFCMAGSEFVSGPRLASRGSKNIMAV